MAVNAGSVYVDLGARLDRREFEAYEKQLSKVREQTQRREHFKAQLGANYDPRAMRAYESDLRKAERATDDHVKATGRLRTAFGSVWGSGGAALAAAGGAYGLVNAVKGVTNAYAESQVSQQKMSQQLKTLGISYDAHAKQIDEVIQRTSKLAGLDDEDLQDAFTAIVRTTKSVNTGLKDMALVADLARAKHLDVARAGELVAKVHAGNVGALRRLGIEFTKSTDAVDHLKETTKKYTPEQLAAAKAQDKATDSTRALGLLQDRFRGQATAYGRTQAGASDRVRVAWENLQETLGQKLAPALTRAMNGVARFVNQMQDGTGAGGKFVSMLQRAGRNFQIFGEHVQDDIHMIAGWVSSAEDATSTVLHWTGVLVGGSAGRKLKQWGDDVDGNADRVKRWRQEMTIKREVDKIDSDLDRLRNKTSGTLHGILTATHRNMAEIRKTMGTESAAGQKAIHDNFQAAVTAIRRAMRQGEISTKTGLAQIRSDMLQELKSLGISSALRGGLPLSKNPPKGDLPVTTDSAPVTKYGGGWIGMPGMVGPDVVPAMLAPGEAVLNRHQQAVIEGMLGDGFLDRLFATVNRPHYMDRGGRIPFAVGGVTPAISNLINELDSKGFHHGSTTTGRHAPTSYHYRGMAVDYGDANNDMQRLWNVVFPQRTRFAELFGPTRVNPGPHLMHNGAAFQDAGLQAQHEDHIHMALAAAIGALGGGSAGPALGAVWKAIRAPRVGGAGVLHDIVQGALDRTTRLANQRGRSLARTAAGPDLGGGPGGGSNSANKALGQRMAAAMGWTGAEFDALDRLWTGESGWSNTARNASSGAFGIPQALPASKMGPAGAGGNPRAQIAWGLNYIKERYGSPSGAYSAWLSRSPHWYAKGGRAGSKLNKLVGGATAGLIRKIRPLQTDDSPRLTKMLGHVENWDNDYSRWERRFNVSDEELVDTDTGAVNVEAVQHKAHELAQLIAIRHRIENELEKARAFIKHTIASYERVIRALRRSLRHAKRKDRKGIESYVTQYEGRVGEWKGKLGEVGDTLFDTRTDLLELRAERAEVLGTQPNIQTPDAPDATDTGGDTPDTGTPDAGTPDAPTVDTPTAPTAADIAAGVIQQLATFQQGRVDLLSGFAPNFVSRRQAYMPGGAFSGSPDELTAAGGVRFFGAGGSGSLGGLAGGTVVAHFASAPPDPPSFVQQMRFLVENGSG